MIFIAQKQSYLKALLGVVVIGFAVISTVGIFGSTEMQAAHHQQGFSLGSSLVASIPDNNQIDHLEDLVAWDNAGLTPSQAVLAALAVLLAAAFSIFPRFKLFTFDSSAETFSRLYSRPSAFSFALQEAFSRGIINGKAY